MSKSMTEATTPKPGAPRYIAASYKARPCKFCGRSFTPHRVDQEFCQAEHRIDYHSRASRRAMQVYDSLIVWRQSRGRKKGLLGDITHIIDGWLDEDRRAAAKKASAT